MPVASKKFGHRPYVFGSLLYFKTLTQLSAIYQHKAYFCSIYLTKYEDFKWVYFFCQEIKYKGGRKAPKINLHLEKMTPALFLPMNTEAAVIWTWNSHRSVNMYLSSTFYAGSTQKQSMTMHNIHNSMGYRVFLNALFHHYTRKCPFTTVTPQDLHMSKHKPN